MKKSYKRIGINILWTLFLFLGNTTQAQTSPPDVLSTLSVMSPTTASLVKFTDIAVSGYTGTPDINIPLYEIVTSFTKIPISLNYHGSGIRVNENASNVGLGWALNAGGVLSRTVYGLPDNGTWQTSRMSRNTSFDITNQTDYQQAPYLFYGTMDGVPDLYMYNFPGYSGKFIIADEVRQLPMTNLRITRVSNNEFNIITPEGNKYIFGATERSKNRTAGSVDDNVVGWYLTKIIAADKADSILFVYADTFYEETGGRNQTMEFEQNTIGQWYGTASSNTGFINSIRGKQLTRIVFKQGSVDFNISWNTREDLSAPDNPAIPLVKGLTVKNRTGVVLHTINFRHDYFTNTSTGMLNKRLKLSGVYIGNSADTSKTQRYNLFYNSGALPGKSSLAQDHWGYYNGANSNTTLIPSYTNCQDVGSLPNCLTCADLKQTLTFTGANRETSGTYAAVGMLERINYPTGGYTSFEWEPHDVPNTDLPTVTYRNVNIGAAQSYPTGSSFVRDSSADYYINPATNPNGICVKLSGSMGIPGELDGDATRITHAGGKVTVYRKAGRVMVASLTFPYSSTYEYDKSVNLNLEAGQSYYVVTEVRHAGFSVVGDLFAKVSTTTPVTPNKLVGGCRLKKMIFSDPVANKSLVKSYEYRLPDNNALSSGLLYREPDYAKGVSRFQSEQLGPCAYISRSGLRLFSNSVITLGSGSHIGYTYVKEYIGEGTANGHILYEYANGGMSEGEFNASWRSGYLRTKSVYNSQGQLNSKEEYKYKTESRGYATFVGSTLDFYTAHPCAPLDRFDGGLPAFASGKNWQFPSEWFHQESTKETIYDTKSFSRGLTVEKTLFYDNALHLQPTKMVQKNSEGMERTAYYKFPLDYVFPAGTLSQEAQAIKNLQATNVQKLVETYEQEKTTTEAMLTTKATYMTYKTISTPNGEIVLLDKQFLYEGSPLSSFVPAAVVGTGMQRDTKYAAKLTVNKYDNNYNISELEQFGANISAYIWDYDQSYLTAKFTNAKEADVAYTSFETNVKGNWTFTGTILADATSITGRNCYNVGSGAITKTGLTASMSYIVSYWTKNSTSYNIAGTVAGYPLKGHTVNGWTYFEHKVSGQSAVTINSTGYIDEIRLYPSDANVITYTYDPLVGVTSECNESCYVRYYTYDDEGRLKAIKDEKGRIIKLIDYQYTAEITR
jgi:hypothetical protein